MHVDMLLACNDDQGEPEQCIRAMQVWHDGGAVLELDGDPLDFSWGIDAVKVEGRVIAARCLQTWAGNWCWDLFRLSFDDAVWMLDQARTNAWTAEGGAQFLYDSFNDGDPLAEPLRLTLAGDETPRRTSKQERAALAAWNAGEPHRV